MILAEASTAAAAAAMAKDPWRLLAASLPLAAISLFAYGRWLRALRTRGGHVPHVHFGKADLMLAVFLALLFSSLAALNFKSAAAAAAGAVQNIDVKMLVVGAMIELTIPVGLGTFLLARKMSLVTLFGLRRVTPPRAFGQAALFILALVPGLMSIAIWLTAYMTQPDEQQIVTFFRTQAHQGNVPALVAVFVTAAIIAPFWEEFVFRGYLYGTLKRYLGPIGAALLVSVLFAAVHANVAAFGFLFLLALSLTVAYEWTGSLVVPMIMHALFNATELSIMFLQVMHAKP